jgi:hypothetical protein
LAALAFRRSAILFLSVALSASTWSADLAFRRSAILSLLVTMFYSGPDKL